MSVQVIFDATLFSGDSIKRALYRLSDRLTGDIESDAGRYLCTLSFPAGRSEETVVLDVANFKKEVLDQDLREKIKLETEPVRNLILAHAFSNTGLIADEQVSTH